MINTLEKYLISLFLKKTILISGIFITLIFILNIFDEISFFKDDNSHPFLPLLMTTLNTPSILFEIFPFIFLLSTQFFFISLIEKNELDTLKVSAISNLKLIKILFFTSFILGTILVIFYYNFSSKLKFLYLDLKNNYSNDNKYLAVVNGNGLWIKDENIENIYIISAQKIENNYLKNVSISEFNKQFDLIKIIKSSNVDIANNKWVIYNAIHYINNKTERISEKSYINTHFNREKINSLFSNLSSLNMFELLRLKKDYQELGYSTKEVKLYMYKLFSTPLYLAIMTIFSSIIMLNTKRNKSLIFHIIFGIFLSVIIYYLYYLFNLFGESEILPLTIASWFPMLILIIFILIGLVRINEK